MNHPKRKLILAAILIALPGLSTFAQSASDTNTQAQQDDAAAANADDQVEEVLVVAQRARRVSSGATNLDLDIKETPQSISVVTKEQMELFGANTINDALRLATGIQVEQLETNRTQYLSRGFEIKNTQIDGVGLPNGWGIVTGAIDSFGYEKLEVIRGANGLLTGVGNVSGTINYVRKRPTNEAQGQVRVGVGSWSTVRGEADYSTPFTDDGSWAGRVVASYEGGDSYLRDFESDRSFFYGVVDGQVGENGTLAFGYSWQQADTTNNMWDALTFVANDGSQLEWDRSASTTQDWTHWDTTTEAGFIDYTHQFGADWELKASYNYRKNENDDQLFLAYSIFGLDRNTGQGLFGWAYKSQDETIAHLGDIKLNVQFDLFGHGQEAMFGASFAESERTDWYYPTDFGGPAFGALPGFPFTGNEIPEPVWNDRIFYTSLDQQLDRFYGATRITLTDRLKTLVGFNWAEYQREGIDTAGAPFDQSEDNVSPYIGFTFDFTDDLLGYISYSDIYQPQEQTDFDGNYLDPSKGLNYEIGIKAEWFGGRLLTTLAVFNAEQEGLATFAGFNFETARSYYVGVDVESTGVEFEATGSINEYTDLVFGYTHLKMDGLDGSDTYRWVPRDTANLMLTSRLPSYPALSFGVGGRWQSDISNIDGYNGFTVRQDSYAVFNAFAAWDIKENVSVRANIGNLTDEKYINSLYFVGYYAPPRNYSVSVDWRF